MRDEPGHVMSAAMTITSPFRSPQRVYFDDLDALNILHNVRFVLFMERARGELFQALGFRWEDDFAANPDKFHVVAAHEIAYVAPVRGEGELVVELRPAHLGRSSFVIDAKVSAKHGDLVHATGRRGSYGSTRARSHLAPGAIGSAPR